MKTLNVYASYFVMIIWIAALIVSIAEYGSDDIAFKIICVACIAASAYWHFKAVIQMAFK